jgi:hypothetical protein
LPIVVASCPISFEKLRKLIKLQQQQPLATTMKQILAQLVGLTVLFATTCRCDWHWCGCLTAPKPEKIAYEKYLDMPKVDCMHRKLNQFHEIVKQALSSLQLGKHETPKSILDKIVDRINQASQGGEDNDGELTKIYTRLASMANDPFAADEDCSSDMLDLIKSVQAQIRANEEHISRFAPFMQKYARQKLESCIEAIEFKDVKVTNELAAFFWAGVEATARKANMLEDLKSIKLTKSKLDVQRMSKIAKKVVSDQLKPTEQQPLRMIREFLDTRCKKLGEDLGTVLDTINLARVLGSQEINFNLAILSELQRLCLSWKKSNLKIIDNFHVRLDAVVAVLRPGPSPSQQA